MKRSLLAIILVLTMFCSSCSTAWVTTLDSILAAAAPALVNILQIVAIAKGAPLNAQLAAKVNGDAATIKSLAADFSTASAAAAPQVCAQLNAALQTYSADQSQILALAQVGDVNTQTKITLLAGLVSGTVQAILAVIPQCQAAPVALKATATPPLKLSAFVADYNAILTAKTGNAAVDKMTPKLKIHQHSKAVRVLTLGLMK